MIFLNTNLKTNCQMVNGARFSSASRDHDQDQSLHLHTSVFSFLRFYKTSFKKYKRRSFLSLSLSQYFLQMTQKYWGIFLKVKLSIKKTTDKTLELGSHTSSFQSALHHLFADDVEGVTGSLT